VIIFCRDCKQLHVLATNLFFSRLATEYHSQLQGEFFYNMIMKLQRCQAIYLFKNMNTLFLDTIYGCINCVIMFNDVDYMCPSRNTLTDDEQNVFWSM